MKKILVAILALSFLAVPAMNAQSRQLKKQLKKEYKLKIKKYSKEDWEVFGTSRTLEVALLMHYDKLNDGEKREIVVHATSTNKNIGKEKLLANACSQYAQSMGSNVKRRIVSDMGSKISPEELAEFEAFYSAYENNVAAEIKGELYNTFCLYRDVKLNGTAAFEFEGYFIVDIDAATQARIRAFENAARESAAAQRYAEQVSEFIKEGMVE